MNAVAATPALTLFLCGDVMTGRGIDQLLPKPSQPHLFERYVTDARDYVRLAEGTHGPIARPVTFDYIWGEALAEIDRRSPQLRIVNLETAITTREDAWPGKGIHYRMHPANAGCLTAARIDACVLANNHVLDWGHEGLAETLRVLHAAGIRTAGAGADEKEAAAPAIFEVAGGGRVLLFAIADESSGVPRRWRAGRDRPGVWMLDELCARDIEPLARAIAAQRRPGDTVIVSLHWGGNWGYAIGPDERAFAQALVEAGADLVHGHSSHHARGFEVFRERLILYGCGDFINDYEGIGGHEKFRGDLAVAYFVRLIDGRLQELTLVPFQSQRLSLRHASLADARWLLETLNRECSMFGIELALAADGSLQLAPVR
jgi:poly-gamma-glutamate capsule biosynthesis protein CapA/YwtB (metallophosphatase superfamily)